MKQLKGLKKKVVKKPAPAPEKPKEAKRIEADKKPEVEKGLFDVRPTNISTLDAFIDWIAMPSVYRKPETQSDFSKDNKIDEDTLVKWKKRPGFYEEVTRRRRKYFKDDAGDVILALKRTCLKGGKGADAKVFLNYTEDLTDKAEVAIDADLKEVLEKVAKLLP